MRLTATPTAAGTITVFQSTHPVRGATITFFVRCVDNHEFQSTHPVRGATYKREHECRAFDISIHAPRAGCDIVPTARRVVYEQFQSTHPVRGATNRVLNQPTSLLYFNPRTPCGVRLRSKHQRKHDRVISIHAPRAGCDQSALCLLINPADFNPRTPCGVRRTFFLLCQD